jgi:thiamine-phosphate pyrophosphorylase
MSAEARLYCILDLGYTPESRAEEVTRSLLAGGADILQLRAKNHDLATIERVARKLLPICRAAGIPFILNDHPALAASIDADGVHIGQGDGTLLEARALAMERGIHPAPDRGIHSGLHSFIHPSSSSTPNPPRPFIIGRSTHSLDQARAALAEGFDYIGFGPLFPTPTKAGRPAIGLQDIATMEREVGARIPAFCIGGITPETLPQVISAGARRVVVVSALLQAPEIAQATKTIKARFLREIKEAD